MPTGEGRSAAAWAGGDGATSGAVVGRARFWGYYGSRHLEIVDPGASSEAVFLQNGPTSAILPR